MAIIKLTGNIIRSINPFNKLLVQFYLIDRSIIERNGRLFHYSNKFKIDKITLNEFSCQTMSLVEKSYYVSYYNYLNNGNHNTYSYFKNMRKLKEEK